MCVFFVHKVSYEKPVPDFFISSLAINIYNKFQESGICLPLDTEIKTVIDNVVIDASLRDLMFKNDVCDVLSYNLKKKSVELDNANIFNTGINDLFEIEFESGRTIRATENHIFYVISETGRLIEKRLKDIKKNDKLLRWK